VRGLSAATTVVILVAAQFSGADAFSAKANVDSVAQRLLLGLPACAIDRLIEARRGSNSWHYRLLLDYDKTWKTELVVDLEGPGAHVTRVEAEVVRTEGGLLFDSERPLPTESAEWTQRIQTFLGQPAAELCFPQHGKAGAYSR
jgi:hypothetical protein